MRLLFITQKIDESYDNLAATIGWIEAFVREGFQVEVICLEKGKSPLTVPVYSLGKEKGNGKLGRLFRFFKYIVTLKYDRVFVHMNSEYITLGGWYWFLHRIPMYLWYTHYTMHVHLWLSGIFCKRMFAATPQSMPQYADSPKRVIIGHGVDQAYWLRDLSNDFENTNEPYHLLAVHRIRRSKRVERIIEALTHLPKEYTLTLYGREDEAAYTAELRALTKEKQLQDRVFFRGPIPSEHLREVYPQHRLLLNMAMETIDKTMVEALLFGLYTITTPRNAKAIGLPYAPEEETPKAIADFILSEKWNALSTKQLQQITKEKHSTAGLIHTMSSYIRPGT